MVSYRYNPIPKPNSTPATPTMAAVVTVGRSAPPVSDASAAILGSGGVGGFAYDTGSGWIGDWEICSKLSVA